MRIGILAWGSLVWDQRGLAIDGQWQRSGPVLPIEFSRFLDDGRLTLVIDELHGEEVPTRYALSQCANLSEAIANLQQREGCRQPENIGFIEVATGWVSPKAKVRHPNACNCILIWAKEKEFNAVIWTALGRRFKDKIEVPFSPAAAIKYLQALPPDQKPASLEYLGCAPAEVMTPVRRAAIEAKLIPPPQPEQP